MEFNSFDFVTYDKLSPMEEWSKYEYRKFYEMEEAGKIIEKELIEGHPICWWTIFLVPKLLTSEFF